jgi:hypothetical protein
MKMNGKFRMGKFFKKTRTQKSYRTSADKSTSPVGTEWSIGTIDQVSQLFFKNLRDTSGNKPKSLVGKNMVLHLVEDNIYISIKFTSWSSGTKGGFAYERSTPK